MYAMGVAVADFDNDGRPDIYITALDGDRLFHNEGKGKFRDVTATSGIKNANFGTSAAWVDYDCDGKADLFVANYIQWSPATDLWCSLDGATKSYCTPESSKGAPSKLYHNLGNGKFEDVSAKSGIGDATSKSLGVVVLDYNNDGWPDLFVSNDTHRTSYSATTTTVRFPKRALPPVWHSVKTALHAEPWASMQSTTTDPAGSTFSSVTSQTRCSVCITTKAVACSWMKPKLLSRPRKPAQSHVWRLLFDYDLDGYPDIFAANGHTETQIENIQPK